MTGSPDTVTIDDLYAPQPIRAGKAIDDRTIARRRAQEALGVKLREQLERRRRAEGDTRRRIPQDGNPA